MTDPKTPTLDLGSTEKYLAYLEDYFITARARNKALAAERDKLKAALEKIAETPTSGVLDAADLLEIVKDRACEARAPGDKIV